MSSVHATQEQIVADQKARTREQRRYEIARDVMAAFMSNPNASGHGGARITSENVGDVAKFAVKAADALLRAMEESSDGV